MKKQSKFRLSNKFRPCLESLTERINPAFTGNYVLASSLGLGAGFVFQVEADSNADSVVRLNTVSSTGATGVQVRADDFVVDQFNIFISDDAIKSVSAALLLSGNTANSEFKGFAVKTLGGGDLIDGSNLSNYNLVVDAGGGNDDITGSPRGDRIAAGDGHDTVFGGAGNDTVTAGAGNDEVSGEQGDDNLSGENGDDVLDGGAGKDAMAGGEGDDQVLADTADFLGADGKPIPSGVVPISGGGNLDFVTPPATEDKDPDVLSIQSFSADKLTYTNSGFEVINGGSGAETINGGAGAQTINGNSGNDSLFGGEGDDSINGGAGNDTVEGGTGSDTMDGGSGTADVLSYFNSPEGVFVVMGTSSIVATGGDASGDPATVGFEGISGSDNGEDFISGNTNPNVLIGNGGNDTINGGGGADELWGDRSDGTGSGGSDELNGGAGNDTMNGGAGGDELNGGSGNDSMLGGSGSDSLTGGTGNDEMDGGDGTDVADGGLGSDTLTIDAKNFSSSEQLFGSADSDVFKVVNATKKVITGSGQNDFVIVLDEALVNATQDKLESMARQNPPTCDYDAAVDALDWVV